MPRNSSRHATSFSLYICFSSSGSQASRSAIAREARKPVLTKQIVTARQCETPKVCSTSLDRVIARSNRRWCRRWQLRIRQGEGRAGMWEGWFQIVPWDWVRAERRTDFWGSRLRVPRPITISPRLSLRKIKINGGISWGTNWKRRKRRPSVVDAVMPIYASRALARIVDNRSPLSTGLRVFLPLNCNKHGSQSLRTTARFALSLPMPDWTHPHDTTRQTRRIVANKRWKWLLLSRKDLFSRCTFVNSFKLFCYTGYPDIPLCGTIRFSVCLLWPLTRSRRLREAKAKISFMGLLYAYLLFVICTFHLVFH